MNISAVRFFYQFRTWCRMFRGKSYWHYPQPLGQVFVPGDVAGYFSDLTRKVEYTGPTNAEGIPYLSLLTRQNYYHPTMLLHKALGHWDAWLLSKRQSEAHFQSFMQLVNKVFSEQDAKGGWRVAEEMRMPNIASSYCGLTQGEAASAFVRAYTINGRKEYLDGAEKSLALMLTPIQEGGTAHFDENGLVFEEFAYLPPVTILNGWPFAIFGLHDYNLITGGRLAKEEYSSAKALEQKLGMFDAGFWSYYDTQRRLASPFYHELHIAQLEALVLTYPGMKDFKAFHAIFQGYTRNPFNKARVIVQKGLQKIMHADSVILR